MPGKVQKGPKFAPHAKVTKQYYSQGSHTCSCALNYSRLKEGYLLTSFYKKVKLGI